MKKLILTFITAVTILTASAQTPDTAVVLGVSATNDYGYCALAVANGVTTDYLSYEINAINYVDGNMLAQFEPDPDISYWTWGVSGAALNECVMTYLQMPPIVAGQQYIVRVLGFNWDVSTGTQVLAAESSPYIYTVPQNFVCNQPCSTQQQRKLNKTFSRKTKITGNGKAVGKGQKN